MFGKSKKSEVELTVSNRTIARVILFLLGTVLLLRMIDNLRHPLTLIAVSFFLALALNPVVSKVSNKLKSKSRVRATAIAYTAVMTVLISFIALIVPPLVSQTTEFIREVPDTLSNVKKDDGALGNLVRRYNLEEQIQNFANDWSRNLGEVQGPVLTTANRVFANVLSIVSVVVLTFMMLVEGPRWQKVFWSHVPKRRRAHDQEIARKMHRVVTSFVNGQVLVASIGAVSAMVALFIASTIVGVSINVVAMAGIVFMFSLIPTVGAILSALLVALFCLFVSPLLALIMIVYFIIYQQVENASVQPMIQSKGTELTPMLVFISAILGLSLAGILGGFVAIPIAGCVKILLDDWKEDKDIAQE
jgi:predicted PurR-regulated permease PerM